MNVAVLEVSYFKRQHAKQVKQAKVSNFWWYDLVLKAFQLMQLARIEAWR
jgi:hypothetical protein